VSDLVDDAGRLALFRARYGYDASLRVDVPGRVNLIGDHIDYNGLGVLPVAIQRPMTLLARARADSALRISSTAKRFRDCAFEVGPSIPAGQAGDWCNYVKAAAQDCAVRHGRLRGLDALVDSDIPVAAGLSSSSALVVASALALLHGNGVDVGPLVLAEHMSEAERYVGTRGGGMDQAILLGARRGCAAHIDFQPLRLRQVTIPRDWRFIVADCGVPAEKSHAMRSAYNTRAAECAQALERVAVAFPACEATYPALTRAHGVVELIDAAVRVLPGDLLRRFRHVISEAARVAEASSAMEQDVPAAFGRLMDASHESLRDDFDVSSRALDACVAVAKSAGAAGARLTGAGFGGCIVALCTAAASDEVARALGSHLAPSVVTDSADARLVFVVQPGAGAVVRPLGN
jgi:galactokinase